VLINDLDVITASKSCHVVFGTDFLGNLFSVNKATGAATLIEP